MIDKRFIYNSRTVEVGINVDELCGILLMEAYYEFIQKLLLGIKLIDTVESRNGFPYELGGVRKLHNTIEIVIHWKLVEDIMR